jgi:hypothetical protein
MSDTDLERRLRRALAARAGSVTGQDLRPIVPERRESRLRWWLPFSAGLAAAAVLMLVFVVFHRPDRVEHPIAPAGSAPATTTARPSLSATVSSSAAPSTALPSTAAPTTAAPSGSASAVPTPAVTSTVLPSARATR